MKKLLVLIIIVGLGFFAYDYFKNDIMKKDDVVVANCKNCEYMVNDQKVSIQNGVVHLNNNSYNDVKEVKAINGIIVLIKQNGVIGYKEKELFNYSDGFDKSYPGMKVSTIIAEKDKIIIQTSRIENKTTINIGTSFPICVDDNLNYKGMANNKIDATEPVTLTYDINYNDYKPVVSYKQTLAEYFKEIGNCKTS